MSVPLKPPRGTRDKLPEEMFARRLVCEKLRNVFELYGYGEVETPAFEHLEVLVAKAGADVVEQIYAFKDKAGRDLGLRFELTTPIARIVASRLEMPKPIRLYYVQPVWRYEEPQKGRLREFWQAGVELIGVEGPLGDAEVIAIAHEAIRRAGLTGFEVHLSHRAVVEDILIAAGLPRGRLDDALRVLDKLEKRGREFVVEELSKLGLEKREAENALDQLLSGGLDVRVKTEEGKKGLEALAHILDILESSYNVKAKVDFGIVRGLGYYTGPVFEVKTTLEGELGSIAGGGRYDDLVSALGGPRIPATGMAIGVERLMEALAAEGKLNLKFSQCDVVVIPVSNEARVVKHAISVAEALRKGASASTIVDYSFGSLAKALRRAVERNARFAVIVGEREILENKVTLKDLANWSETKLTVGEAVREVSRIVNREREK